MNNMEFSHIPVLLNETLEGLNIKPEGIYVDGTAGGAGHSKEIAKRLCGGKLIALDRDPDAIKVATERLAGLPATVVKSNYRDMRIALDGQGIDLVDGIMLDIGVSSFQLDNGERGFSFHEDAPLDMRMSKEGTTAADLVNSLDVYDLTNILRDYGEEKFAFKIDNKISQNQSLVLRFFPSAILKRRRTSDKCEEAENPQCSNYHSETSYSYYYLLPGRHILLVRILNLQLRKPGDISKSLAKRDADLRGSIDRPSIGIKERGNVASAKLEPGHNHSWSRNT